MVTSTDKTSFGLEYMRRLHADVMDWYYKADTKAQVILTLDAAFLTFVATSILQDEQIVIQLPWFTLVLLFGMALSLVISIYSAIACIWSRIHSRDYLRRVMKDTGVDLSDFSTYSPHISWFFQFVSALEVDEFEKRMQSIDVAFEINALAYQTHILSGNVCKKHQHVNRGFLFAAIALFLLISSVLSFVLHGRFASPGSTLI